MIYNSEETGINHLIPRTVMNYNYIYFRNLIGLIYLFLLVICDYNF